MSVAPLETIAAAISSGDCRKLVLSDRRHGASGRCTKITIRPILLRGQTQWQFTFHEPDRVTHENLEGPAAAARATHALQSDFRQAALYTSTANISLSARGDGGWGLRSSPPTKGTAPASHNRAKEYLIPEGTPCPFLAEIGVMTADGQVRRSMYHKFRQINRFLELVDDVVPALPTDRELQIVDFGCGKSYLTFALHHLLTQLRSRQVHLVGLDRKTEVLRDCTALAGRLACQGLEFQEGDLAHYEHSGTVDLAVSLHACDTATDLALASAIRWETKVILAVPCCQHELAPQIQNADLVPLTRHGILHDRFAALATDALRALLLEIHGYQTQVVEFIDLEHTPKNILLRAVRRDRIDPEQMAQRRAEFATFKKALGIDSFALERALADGGKPANEDPRHSPPS